ncbi:flagellar basal body P-ring formation chaperone FlgA [Vibrio sp. 10N]|uniref:flagellar basal body P-ring formation chaperone FlgA n=1 Tax=Vibrio sp. 10N TaxID=3058938 RepID=UPI0030C6CCD1
MLTCVLTLPAQALETTSEVHSQSTLLGISNRLKSRIERAIKRRYPESATLNIKLRFSKALNHVQPCPIEPIIETKREVALGSQKWFVSCPQLGWKASAMATSQLSVLAATASKTLKKGHRVQSTDTSLSEVTLTKDARLFYQVDEVLGSKLKRSVKKGDILSAQRFYLDYDVEKGLPVSVIYHSKTFSLETQGVALEDGQVGDVIAIKNAKSGRQLRGQVVEKNLVRVF